MRAAAVGLITIAAAVVALAQDVAAGRIAVGDRAAEDACSRGQALQGIVAVVQGVVAVVLGIRVRCAAQLTDQVAEAVVAVAQAVRARSAPAQRVRLARAVIIAVRAEDLSIQDLTLVLGGCSVYPRRIMGCDSWRIRIVDGILRRLRMGMSQDYLNQFDSIRFE